METLAIKLPGGPFPNDVPRGLPLGEFEAFVLAGLRFGPLSEQAEQAEDRKDDSDHRNWEPFRL